MIKEFILGKHMPFKACHASTVIETRSGGFLAAWFGGSREGGDDVAIWGSRKRNNAWSEPELFAKVNAQPHWNPVLFSGSGSELFLYFKIGKNCRHWQTWVMSSKDDGENWSIPKKLIPGNMGGRGPVKNKCLELSDGIWLAPASSEIGWWQAFVDRSEDKGRSWSRSGFVPMDKKNLSTDENGGQVQFQVIQPSLWESTPGSVHMLLRSSSGKICRSDSGDGGRSWSKIYEISLPNNNSGIDLAKLSNGELLLAFNPVGKNWGPRCPMTLVLSKDNGETWGSMLDMEKEPGREYSYPAVISTSDGGAAITYTWGRENIAFVKLTSQDLGSKFKSSRPAVKNGNY
ncbi:MAG: sialidase family protein [Victivallales bacterium]